MAAPVTNCAHVLHLSVALCVLNDTHREAERLGVQVDGVSVEADGNFDEEWCSTGIEYSVTIDARTADRSVRLATRMAAQVGLRRLVRCWPALLATASDQLFPVAF